MAKYANGAIQMISLTNSPILVALVETAGSLPIFLRALPAGALADVKGYVDC